jgi:hypothetical protein
VTPVTFVRLLGCIYLIAFISFGVQSPGLIGSHGIEPYGNYLNYFRKQFGGAAWRYVPTVLWLSPADGALRAVWILGAVCALLAAVGPGKKWFERTALGACLVLWLSLCSVGQDFLSFQWDALLIETGFLALFADATPVRVWLFRWLAFRLMFYSGVVKLASHDAAWRDLTALHYHYETQPLPNPLAWYMYQLPMWFQKFSTAVVFAGELAVPFLFFAPRRLRHIGAWITIGLQLLIFATGNYTFFNILAIALTIWLLLDTEPWPADRFRRARDIVLAAFVGGLSGIITLQILSLPLPPGCDEVLHVAAPFQIVNSYGLFAVMTTTRDEIVVEGSGDGVNWRAYEFRYKPGGVRRAPPVVEPHQPRLDWQMWFAALSNYQQNRWFVNFMVRLLQGEPAVLRLLESNPFPRTPPKYIRARLYRYHFTHWGEHDWWTREERGMYFPPVSLK